MSTNNFDLFKFSLFCPLEFFRSHRNESQHCLAGIFTYVRMMNFIVPSLLAHPRIVFVFFLSPFAITFSKKKEIQSRIEFSGYNNVCNNHMKRLRTIEKKTIKSRDNKKSNSNFDLKNKKRTHSAAHKKNVTKSFWTFEFRMRTSLLNEAKHRFTFKYLMMGIE